MEPMDHKQLRMRGLAAVKGNWGLSIGAAVVAYLLAGLGISFFPNFEASWVQDLSRAFGFEFSEGTRVSFTLNPASALSLAVFIIGGVIELGYCKFLLKQQRGEEYQFNDLFSEFDRFGDGFAQRFLRGLYTFLWSLLLIIPGLIKSLSYAMTPYIMAENPGMKAGDAITRSKEMMDGYKADLFVLRLTFIGWDLLAALTLGIGNLWLNPYKHASEAAFYQELKLRKRYGN